MLILSDFYINNKATGAVVGQQRECSERRE